MIMSRIKIRDLPTDQKISREELRMVVGGGYFQVNWPPSSNYSPFLSPVPSPRPLSSWETAGAIPIMLP